MKRGTASRVFFGVDKTNEDFGGLLLLSQVTLGKKSGMFDEHKGLCIVDNVLLGKGIARVISVIIRGTSPLTLPDAIADSLSYVKAFGGTKQGLPDGYTQLEYIESTGTQYIDTGIIALETDEITVIGTATTTSSQIFFSQGASSNNQAFQLANTTNTNGIVFDLQNYDPYRIITGVYAYNNVVTVRIANKEIFVNGTSYGTSAGTLTNPTDTMRLFISSAGAMYNIQMQRFTITGKIDLVPAKNSSGVVGMYDTVSGTFFTNAGTGEFIAGPEAVPTPDAPMDIISNNGVVKARHQSGLPLGYQKVEKLTFTQGAYIITDIYPNQDTEFIVDVQKDTDNLVWLFGTRNYPSTSSPSVNKYSLQAFSTTTNSLWFQFDNTPNTEYNSVAVTSSQTERLARHTLGIKNKQIWMDGSAVEWGSYGVPSWSNFTALNPLIIGGNYQQAGGIKGFFSGDLYGATGLILCKRLSDNVLGVYNPTTGNFSSADGTGTITAGNTVSDPIEIYTDGTTETVEVHSKNLFDTATMFSSKSMAVSGGYLYWCYGVNGKAIKVPCKPNTTYTLSYTGGNRCFIGGFTNDVPLESDSSIVCDFLIYNGSTSSVSPKTFTTPENCYYVCCGLANSSGGEVTDIQLEQGSTATTYAPYYNGGTATTEMLLKVGDYQDVQSIIDGVVTRKVGVKVLDGTETGWTKLSGANYVSLPKTAISNMARGTDATCLSNSFAQVAHSSISLSEEWFSVGASYVNFKKAGDPTTAQFKQWLADQYAAGTPVIVIYPLATPTTESVAGQTLQVTDGDNTLEITQASLDGLELEAQYQAAVSLTIQEVQDANLDPNVEVTIN